MRKISYPLTILVFILFIPAIAYGWGCKDRDGDGHYGISPYCPEGRDCNDRDPAVYPGAKELCDGKDNNCDGQVDEGLSTDADGDGHYAIGSCKQPADDCNDNDPAVYPGAPEICDGKDNNCDGQVDEGFFVGAICMVGIGACERQGILVCSADGAGTICNATPGQPSPEICDGIDNNCNGIIDEDCQRECPVPPLTPLTDPLAIRMEGGETVIYEGLTQAMLTAVNCFRNAVTRAGGTLTITSAYRPPQYQQHLWEVWNRYRRLVNDTTPECSELRNQVIEEFRRHGLSLRGRPASRDSVHTRGTAIDATVTVPAGQNVDTLANSCGLHRPYPKEPWHFELR